MEVCSRIILFYPLRIAIGAFYILTNNKPAHKLIIYSSFVSCHFYYVDGFIIIQVFVLLVCEQPDVTQSSTFLVFTSRSFTLFVVDLSMCVNVLLMKIYPKVQSTMEQYELDTFGRSHDIMSNFWNSCFDDLMSTAFKRDKDRSDSKSKFQVTKLSGFHIIIII